MKAETFPIVLDHERLIEEKAVLQDAREVILNGITIVSGEHPKHGRVHIVFPALGEGVILLTCLSAFVAMIPTISRMLPQFIQSFLC